MASAKSITYPKIGERIWLMLRLRFTKTMPTVVGPDYIISTSNLSDASARSNVLSPLRDVGILDKENRPTEIAERWRHDDDYQAVCKEIRDARYPSALIGAYPEGSQTQNEGIKRWFMKNSKVGGADGKMFADTYMLLSKGDLTVPDGEAKAASATRSAKAAAPAVKKSSPKATPQTHSPTMANGQEARMTSEQYGTRKRPSVHINVQVHISPDTTPERIDRIFASMSNHLGSYIG